TLAPGSHYRRAMLQLTPIDLAAVTGGAKGGSSLIEATKLQPVDYAPPRARSGPDLAAELGLTGGKSK
ncbi:MAG TPA: hypothetical protein VFQ65_07215, partial [Kofleriaceae bacterium]|nr:hypothetical protein [Kofleriaceae bacterium]